MSAAHNTSSDAKAAGAGAGASAAGTYQRTYLAHFDQPLQTVTAAIPQATKAGSAVIRVLAADVFPNAKEIYGGKLYYKPPAPFTPGGSVYGVVVAVADDVVGGPRVGAHVVADRLLRQNEAEFLLGLFTMTPPEHAAAGQKQVALWKEGTWGQYCVLPAQLLVAVPDAVVKSTPVHVLLRAVTLSIAYGALVTRGRFEAGQSVLVGGATGPHGLATVLLALAAGADTVWVMGRSAAKLKSLTAISPRVKALATGDGSDEKALAAAMAPAANAVDCFVDFYPFLPSAALTLAGINALKRGGTAVIGGGVQATLALPYMQFLLRQITVTGSFMYTPDTIARVLKLLGAGAIDYAPYKETAYHGVDQFNAAIEAAAAQRDDAFRSHVVYPNGKL